MLIVRRSARFVLIFLHMLLHDFLLIFNDIVVHCLLQRCLFKHSLTFFDTGRHEDIFATVALLLRHRRLVKHLLLSTFSVFQRGLTTVAVVLMWRLHTRLCIAVMICNELGAGGISGV